MYRIKVRNDATGAIWYEYGFSHWCMKRIHFLFNKTYEDGFKIYEVLDISAIVFNFSTFKKCLFKKRLFKVAQRLYED